VYSYVPEKSTVGIGNAGPGFGVVIRLLAGIGTFPDLFRNSFVGGRILHFSKTVIS
jgi:hypothetical protein